MRKALSIVSLLLLAMLFIGVVLINNELFNQFRADLTERNIYSLSDGSAEIISEIDEPVNLYYFFSDTATKGMPQLRHYASRVESLLEEYEKRAGGKIRLQKIEPVAFSEAEDRAAEFGLTAANMGQMGESVYFGLAGTNTLDKQVVIPFFDPQKEQFLEYDISELLYQLSDPDPVSVAVVSSLPLDAESGPVNGRYAQGMVVYEQLSQLFDVTLVSPQAEVLPANADVLVLVHPHQLSDAMDYAIDQFAMNKGRILAFIDPHYESQASKQGAGANASQSLSLFSHLGISVEGVVLDPALGLDIRDQQGAVVRHLGILGVGEKQLNSNNMMTANLEMINGASFGAISLAPSSPLNMDVLAQSSDNASLVAANDAASSESVQTLSQLLGDDTASYPLAASFSGAITSAFSASPLEGQTHRSDNLDARLIVVSDADLLGDQFWVQQSAFFGETVYSPFANNGDLVINATESLAGSNSLTRIRSRGKFSRPFTRVQALEVKAQEKFRARERQLQRELEEIEVQLSELQSQQGQSSALALSADQQKTVDRFIDKRALLRKSLREVRFQLARDIDELGYWLKFLNIAVAPLVLVILLFLLSRLLRKRAGKDYWSDNA